MTDKQLEKIAALSEKLHDSDYEARPGTSDVVRAALESLFSMPQKEQRRIIREHWNPQTRRIA